VDTTPLGRVLNRFSYDTEVADTTLLPKLFQAMAATNWLSGAIAVLLGVLFPYSLACIPVLFTPYFYLLQFSRKSIRELQRLDSISRSPIQSVFAEIIAGIKTVRAYRSESRYEAMFAEHIDANSAAVLCFNTSSRWLGVRLEVVGHIMATFAGVCSWLLHDRVTPGLLGLLLNWSMVLTTSLNFNCMYLSQAEAAFTSVERLVNYSTDVPCEGAHEELDSWLPFRKNGLTTIHQSPKAASTTEMADATLATAALEFQNVSLRYREGLPLALDDASFTVLSGERVAVVGRTGAGKSTLAVALFRLAPLAGGRVLLNGLDMGPPLPLDSVRRSVGIITQDPVMFSGTVRYNLDPFSEHSDEACQDALEWARAGRVVLLSDSVADAGANRSVGERQLICLARALLAKPKLLFCDEATSALDERCDAEVQCSLREASVAGNIALLTVAHRLLTVADYNRIIVLGAGKIIETGKPSDLLERENGAFQSLVEQAGVAEAQAIRHLVLCADAVTV